MKVGKEGIVGTIAALEAWEKRDHAASANAKRGYLEALAATLGGAPGRHRGLEPDPTDNPLDRLKVQIEPPGAHITAWDLADALASGTPPVIVRDHEVEHGFFYMDPCNLHPGEETDRRGAAGRGTRQRARQSNEIIATPLERRRNRRAELVQFWPD